MVMEVEGKMLFTGLIPNIKKEETNCHNVHLKTSMASPEPQVSSTLLSEETQIVPTDLIHNIKNEETTCHNHNVHLKTSMTPPEPQVSSTLLSEETQIVPTDLIHNIKNEETTCHNHNIHLKTSMTPPEPQISSTLLSEETQIVPTDLIHNIKNEETTCHNVHLKTSMTPPEPQVSSTLLSEETEIVPTDLIHNIKNEETNCHNVHLKTSMAPPEPQVSTTLLSEETQIVPEIDPLESPSWPRCIRVMDTAEPPVAKIPRMETEASSPENSDDTIAIKQELCLAEGPYYELQSETNQDSAETENAFEHIRFHWNMREIQTRLETEEQCVIFAEDRGLIPTKKMCSYHHRPMSLRTSRQHLGFFQCNKNNCRRKKFARTTGTWFFNANMPLSTVFQIMYMYCHQYTYLAARKASARDDGKMLSTATLANWYTYCRETVIVYHLEHQEADYKIGGPGKTVHIKQVKIGERQFKSGSHIEGQWVLVMMETGNDDLRLEVCPDNEESAKMLLPMMVEKHIKVGTKIRTSSWVAYHCLSDHGFVHKTGNCSTENGDEELKGTDAEDTDSNWEKLKTLFKRYQYKNYTDWLVEYSWRQKIKKSHKCPFEELLKAVKYVY